MEEESLADTVSNLQQRVSYLERELDDSYEQHQFRRTVSSLFPGADDSDIEFRDGKWGTFARITSLDVDQVNEVVGTIENSGRSLYDGFDYSIIEAADGLGLEVYRGPEYVGR